MIAQARLLWLPNKGYDHLLTEADRTAPLETGGVLMGYWGNGNMDVIVTHVIGPGPRAFHQRDRFVPDHTFQMAEITRVYEESDRRSSYLGDWHTHPGAPGYLSYKDRRTLKRIALEKVARAPLPTMLILGNGPRWEPMAWLGHIVNHWLWHHSLSVEALEVRFFGYGEESLSS